MGSKNTYTNCEKLLKCMLTLSTESDDFLSEGATMRKVSIDRSFRKESRRWPLPGSTSKALLRCISVVFDTRTRLQECKKMAYLSVIAGSLESANFYVDGSFQTVRIMGCRGYTEGDSGYP